MKGNFLGKILIDAIPLLISSLLEELKLFIVIDDPHLEVVLFPLHLVETAILRFHVQWLLDLLWKEHLGDDDVEELEAFGSEHLVQKVLHLLGVGLTLDLVHLKMSLATDEHSDTLSQGSFKLLIELVD